MTMEQMSYLSWAINNTPTCWWHDSADPQEVTEALERGAVGVTTNPVLSNAALIRNRVRWQTQIDAVLGQELRGEAHAEALTKIAIQSVAQQFMPEFEASRGQRGYVCAQVNPGRVSNREIMLAAARRLHAWAPNIAVKLPATRAGLDVMKTCVVEGITVTITLSFSVAQVIAIAEDYRQARAEAKKQGVTPGRCYAVIMIGRVDDYIREVATDRQADLSESDIRQAGLAVTKRACKLYQDRQYEAELIVAALRGPYHMTELTGARVIMSIARPYQADLLSPDLPHEERIDRPIAPDVINRLCTVPDFQKAYDPDALRIEDFLSYGVTQKTLTQFHENWKQTETFGR